jgi:hypothetical protein
MDLDRLAALYEDGNRRSQKKKNKESKKKLLKRPNGGNMR